MSELTKSPLHGWDTRAQDLRARFAAENEAFAAVLGYGGMDYETLLSA